MPSAINAKILINRRAGDRASTTGCNAVDIIVNDLSCGGGRVSGDVALAVDDYVTVGLPGIGACPAKVVWAKHGDAGLEFHPALTGHDVDIACETNRLIDGHFGLVDKALPPMDDDESDMLPVRRRLGIIIASAIFAWCIAIAAVRVAIKLL